MRALMHSVTLLTTTSNYIDRFKNVLVNHVNEYSCQRMFKVSITSTHAWSQMVMPASVMLRSKSKQVCIRRFCRSLLSWVIVSYTHCCITPHISTFKAHDDPGPPWWSWCNLLWRYPAVTDKNKSAPFYGPQCSTSCWWLTEWQFNGSASNLSPRPVVWDINCLLVSLLSLHVAWWHWLNVNITAGCAFYIFPMSVDFSSLLSARC